MKNAISRTSRAASEKLKTASSALWRGATQGFGGDRFIRYGGLGIAGVAAIWLLTGAYLFLTPKSYESGFTLVLPGSGAGASVNLENIGQATSLSQSPFSNQRVNPTESYKRLMLNERVHMAAKDILETDYLPKPRIKLLDQTQFMEVSIVGSSPEEARERAEAVEKAFLSEVDTLRADERSAREAGYIAMIDEFRVAVSEARADLVEHQSKTGLASLDQFHANVAFVEGLKQERDAARTARLEAERRRDALLEGVGLNRIDAGAALMLAADPTFMALASEHADVETALSSTSHKFGANHPRVVRLTLEHEGLTDELGARGGALASLTARRALKLAKLIVGDEYGALLQTALEAHALTEAAIARENGLTATLADERERLAKMGEAAAVLDDLNRAHQVAEAVFRSAMARIDTTKTDLFASYPLIQTLRAPFTPAQPSSPIPLLGILGGVVASLLYIMGLALTCLRLPIIRAVSKIS